MNKPLHQRVNDVESELTKLRAELAQYRGALRSELLSAISDSKNVIQDSIRVPQDGAPGKDGAKGDTGATGAAGRDADVSIVGDPELVAAVGKLKAEKASVQAAFLLQVDRASKVGHAGLRKVLQQALDELKRDAEL